MADEVDEDDVPTRPEGGGQLLIVVGYGTSKRLHSTCYSPDQAREALAFLKGRHGIPGRVMQASLYPDPEVFKIV